MDDDTLPGSWLPARAEGDPARVAVLLPGGGYSPARPLLHFARAVLQKHGWTTQELWWPNRWPQDENLHRDWINEHAARAVAAEPGAQVLLVGKSLGTWATRTAAELGLPGIWLTPLLHKQQLVEDLRRATAPALLIGGTADVRTWRPEIVRELGHSYLELEGADHGLETDDDPVNSAEILKQVTAAMDEFAGQLQTR